MTKGNGLKLTLLLTMAMALVGCGSTPPVSMTTTDSAGLRDSKTDLIFATEFPVTGKSDAMSRAAQAWSSGDIDRALFFYVRALQFDSEDVDLIATIGKIHYTRNRPGMAVRAFSLALRIDPDNAMSLEGRGLIFLANDRNELAEVDLQRAVGISPNAWRAHNGLGMLADRRGDHLIATMHYDAALAIVPESPVVLNNRGYSSFLAGDYRSATADLHLAAGQHGYQRAWINLGGVYAREGRYIPAVDMYLKVLSEAETYNKVAEAAIANSDYETAQQMLEQAIYESPIYFPAAEENLSQLRLLKQ
jgi:Flp pilus assembly protein TadD